MYQSQSNIIQNINKSNIKNTETSPLQTNTPPQMLLQNYLPLFIGMAKGSVLLVGVDAVKLGWKYIQLILHSCHLFSMLILNLSKAINPFQDDLECIWRCSWWGRGLVPLYSASGCGKLSCNLCFSIHWITFFLFSSFFIYITRKPYLYPYDGLFIDS